MPATLLRRPLTRLSSLAALVSVLALPTVAEAGTLTAGTTADGVAFVAYVAYDGEANDFRIAAGSGSEAGMLSLYDDPEIVLDDDAVAFGCISSFGDADCPMPDVVVADMGDGDDRLSGNGTALAMVAGGGPGSDRLLGGTRDDLLAGDGGDDFIVGYEGDDEIDGGEGDDILNALDFLLSPSSEQGAGADVLIGGPGTDWVDYDIRSPGVSITLDGVANDGEPNEGDDVRSDIERLEGSTGDDTIIGDDGPQEIDGDLGADRLSGAGGADLIYGKSGNDVIDGGAGSDRLFGDFGCLSLSCGGGVDRLLARDGERDEVFCGPDADSVVADDIDVIETSTAAQACETRDIASTAPPAGAGSPSATSAPSAGGASIALAGPSRLTPAVLARGFTVRITSPVGGRVRVTLKVPARLAKRLRLRSRTIARASATVAAGQQKRVRVRLSAKLRRKARKFRRSALTLAVVVTTADGDKRSASRKLRVR